MVSFVGKAQVNLNEYKYIVVPKKFDGFKNENQHQTSTIIKYLFSKKGFITVYEDNLPADLNANRCLGLVVDLIDNSTMFTTKTALGLKDCNNQEVFLSQEGKSKQKDYKEAFGEAINKAFNSFTSLNYVYEPKEGAKEEAPVTISFKNDVKTLGDEPKLDNNQDPMVEQIATEEVQSYKDRKPIISDYKKAETSSEKKMIEQKATEEKQSVQNTTTVQTEYEIGEVSSLSGVFGSVLYAQELPNGYQLVDSSPKIQLKIFKSSMPNIYIATSDDRNGVVYTSDGKWFFEYQEGAQIVKEELTIKF